MHRNFNWARFGAGFLYAVLQYTYRWERAKKFKDSEDMLAGELYAIYPEPEMIFVENHTSKIVHYVVQKHPNYTRAAFAGVYPSDIPWQELYDRILSETKKKNPSKVFKTRLLNLLFMIGEGSINAVSDYSSKRILKLRTAENLPEVELYDFQKQAVEELNKSYFVDNKDKGLLVMPTGGGKTRTAVAFLLSKAIQAGYQILWVTHRHMLVDQAANTFFSLGQRIPALVEAKEGLELLCCSSRHANIKSAEKSNDVIIGMRQTLNNGFKYLKPALRQKVMIVVDEAHHTEARQYRDILAEVRKYCSEVKLLGLTATPVRYDEEATGRLQRIYGYNIIFNIPMSKLIEDGILARPDFKKLETQVSFEKNLSDYERSIISHKDNDMPPSLIKKIAESKPRNIKIVKYYKENQKQFGKTLVFASTKAQAITLTEEFKKQIPGIKVDYVTCDRGSAVNEDIIRKFQGDTSKDKNALDVLINVNILSEGSDVPRIQTVFLSRDTNSEVLLLQQIGRGLRGEKSGGTKSAYIVELHDKWEMFNKWMNPQNIIQMNDIAFEETKPSGTVKTKTYLVEDIIAEYERVNVGDIGKLNVYDSIPCGFYKLFGQRYKVEYNLYVFEEQHKRIQRIISDYDHGVLKRLDLNFVKENYLAGLLWSITDQDLGNLLYCLKNSSCKMAPYYVPSIEFIPFELYDIIDVQKVAEKVKDYKYIDMKAEIRGIWNTNKALLQRLHGDFDTYWSKIDKAIDRYNNPVPDYLVEELPVKLLEYKLDGNYDLNELFAEVKFYFQSVKHQNISDVTISWTDKPNKSYFGMYYPDRKHIDINKLLDSKRVDTRAIEYIIYHELLHHLHYDWGHNTLFKEEEAQFPGADKWEIFLRGRLFQDYKMVL